MPVPVNKAPGDWHPTAYRTVASEMTNTLDLGPSASQVIDTLVHIHFTVYTAVDRLKKRQGRVMQIGPRFFLDFIDQYVALSNEKREALEEEQRHLNVGLDKLRETVRAFRSSIPCGRTYLTLLISCAGRSCVRTPEESGSQANSAGGQEHRSEREAAAHGSRSKVC